MLPTPGAVTCAGGVGGPGTHALYVNTWERTHLPAETWSPSVLSSAPALGPRFDCTPGTEVWEGESPEGTCEPREPPRGCARAAEGHCS